MREIYEHIFNGGNYTEQRREAAIRRLYGTQVKQLAVWKPDAQRVEEDEFTQYDDEENEENRNRGSLSSSALDTGANLL